MRGFVLSGSWIYFIGYLTKSDNSSKKSNILNCKKEGGGGGGLSESLHELLYSELPYYHLTLMLLVNFFG